MARKVFFSFHYQRDHWRVNQVRNSWLTHGTANTFMDAAEWERVKRKGVRAVRTWIDNQLVGTSVTVVLIGKETSTRKHVIYEIEKSYDLGKGLLGIYIHDLKDQRGEVEWWAGSNPFSQIELEPRNYLEEIIPSTLSDEIKTYNWVDDKGYLNLPNWIELAAKTAGR